MTVLIKLFIIVSFSEGLLELIGISTFYTRIICVCLIVFISFLFFTEYKNKIKTFGLIKPLALLLIISTISMLLNEINFISYSLFIIFVFIYPILFFTIVNIDFNRLELRKIFKIIEVVFIIQIAFGVIKLISSGPSEKFIGTLSLGSGSLGFVFPAFAISYYIPKYLNKKKIFDLVLILGFLVFGISSDKRIIILFIPVLIIIGLYLFNKKFKVIHKRLSPQLIIAFILLIIIFIYASIRLMPTLNPDNKIGGRFDLNFSINYLIKYNESEAHNTYEMKRFAALSYFPSILLKKNTQNFLLGNGPGDTIGSRLNNNKIDPMIEKYGVRYGGRTTFVWLILQVGILGFFAFIWFYFRLLWVVYKNFIANNNINIIILSIVIILLYVTFLIDLIIYSNSFFKSFALMGLFTIFCGISLNNRNFLLHSSPKP